MSKHKRDPAYLREQGKRTTQSSAPKRKITFCLSKHVTSQGETVEEWGKLGLLTPLFNRLKLIGQYSVIEVRQNKYIKEYNKVDFPPNSGFKAPTHIVGVTWAVMHITTFSKEVVVGFIEDDVFYIIFLDKDHLFWPTTLKNT